jgi:ribose 5-phosphate isomerase A
MVVGLGHGSTALHAVRRIAQLRREGQLDGIRGVPCSREVAERAADLGIPLMTLDDWSAVDLTIDGADEVDPLFNLIKGGGGALLREKIVAQASLREVIVVDSSKLSPALGTRSPVPVEVLEYGWTAQECFVRSMGGVPVLRKTRDGKPVETDQGNLILDCRFGPLADPAELAAALDARAGIVGHGLFVGLATDIIIAGAGGIRHVRRNSGRP